jgi:colicin import membrane protein
VAFFMGATKPQMEQTTPETEVATGITEDQAVQELLGKWASKETPEPEAKAEEPEEEPQESQPEEGTDEPVEETEEEATEGGEIEIDVAGEKFKVPAALQEQAKRIEAKAKEVEAGATRKFQAAADLQKAAETQIQAAKQFAQVAQAQADLMSDHKMVARRLQQLEAIDIQNTDAETLTRLNAEYNQLQAAQRRIETQVQQNAAQMQEQEAAALKAKLENAEKVLQTRVKGWGPEKAKALTDYAISRGAPVEALKAITEPWMVEVLDDAAYGRQMREHRPQITKRVQEAPKTLKPGASGKQPAAVVKVDQAMQRVRKTGSINDAAAALLARSQIRKR